MRRMYSLEQIKNIALEKIEATENLHVFENIVDKDGHKRFIEGDIKFNEITGITKTYAKWSLSGSHLLIVCCGTIANTTAVEYATELCTIDLPQWIKDKIVVLLANVVEFHTDLIYNVQDVTSQSLPNQLRKAGTNIKITIGALTLTADRTFRLQYDLLIDNE